MHSDSKERRFTLLFAAGDTWRWAAWSFRAILMTEIVQLLSEALPEIIGGLVVSAIVAILGLLHKRASRRKSETVATTKSRQASIISDKAKLFLHQLLVNRFDGDELQDFCFYLSVNYDSLPGERKSNKAWEFIEYLEQHHLVYDFVRLGSQLRPDISWLEILHKEKITTPDSIPTDICIIPPTEELSPNIAAFSGHWSGHWDGVLLSSLIVENINSEAAVVVYTWCIFRIQLDTNNGNSWTLFPELAGHQYRF